MGIEQKVIFKCDYCKAVETFTMPVDPTKTRHWVGVTLNQIIDRKIHGVNLHFDSVKCATQTLKKISEYKVAITKDFVPPKEQEAPSKVRETVRFDLEGRAEEVHVDGESV